MEMDKTLVASKTKSPINESSSQIMDKKVIPVVYTSEIILRVEEIPPLNIFYSLEHCDVMSRQKKKRRMEHSQELIPGSVPLDVVWKDYQANSYDELAKISQYAGAYATTTIFKATKVKQLVKEKYEKILQLEQKLLNSRHAMEQERQLKLSKLQTEFDQLKVQNKVEIKI